MDAPAQTRIDPAATGDGDPTLCMAQMDNLPPGMILTQDVPGLTLYREEGFSLDPPTGAYDSVADTTELQGSDVQDFLHLANKNLLFVGDSTVEELMWDTLFTLNETVPIEGLEGRWHDVPAPQCHEQGCSKVCDGRDLKSAPHQVFHNLGRCSNTAQPECLDTMPNIKKLNATFGFLWAASPFVCCNGYPGLHGAMRNPQWMDVFAKFASRAPYDVIVLSTGTHDFYGAGNPDEYMAALKTFLGMLEQIGKEFVMVNPQGDGPNRMNKHIISTYHPSWRIIDRIKYHEHLHCNPVHYTTTYFHYQRTKECHGLVRDIFHVQ